MAAKVPLSVTDLKDIQAGPVAPIPTRFTAFLFFVINDVQMFKDVFREEVLPHITSSDDARKIREEVMQYKARNEMASISGINVSFSQQGLSKLLSNADPMDSAFSQGQFKRAQSLGDDTGKWLPEFKGDPIHGFFEITGYPELHVKGIAQNMIKNALESFSGVRARPPASVVFEHYGNVRPGEEKGHEHFGFNDGISQPFVRFEDDDQQVPKRESNPGQTVIDPGILILGQPGDESASTRPAWAKNGTFVVYRHLKQLVPEFNVFLKNTVLKTIFDPPHPMGAVTDEADLKKRIDFLGARLMGRWKSGLPVVLTPMTGGMIPVDNPVVGKDPKLNNNFDYGPRTQIPREQFLCPFAAHARKTGPRTDTTQDDAEGRMIRRGGIPYGCELQQGEETETLHERGLSFVCYQSSLEGGFELIQKSWSNNIKFPFNTGAVQPGFDPIIGQKQGEKRTMTGADAEKLAEPLTMPFQFVISQGGEYFFLPSITALKLMSAKQ